jgi:hypothetical protein
MVMYTPKRHLEELKELWLQNKFQKRGSG